MNTFSSKFAIIPQKKQVVKIRKIKADSDSDSDENHTWSSLQKIVSSKSSSAAQAIYIFSLMFLVFRSEISM